VALKLHSGAECIQAKICQKSVRACIETAITLATALDHPDLPALQALLAEIKVQRGE